MDSEEEYIRSDMENPTSYYGRILSDYSITCSIKDTAKNLAISTVKVRRVLITEGLWSSRSSKAVGDLYRQGYTVRQIADELFMTVKNVQAYIPYNRGIYGGTSRSDSAVWSVGYRERMRTAAEKQVNAASKMNAENQLHFGKGEKSQSTDRAEGRLGKAVDSEDWATCRQAKRDGSKNVATEDNLMNKEAGKKVTARPFPLSEKMEAPSSAHQIMKLHIEIVDDWLDEDGQAILNKYGRLKGKTISRDVLVPSEMTLHALHYAIQKLFGWQNSHLHHYSLPEGVFDKVTEKNFGKWARLCGVLFRFPCSDEGDLFWDDDYEEGVSFKTWLRMKYNGPYKYGGLGDYYMANVAEAKGFHERCTKIDIKEGFNMDSIREAERKGEVWKPKVLKTAAPEECTLEEISNTIVFDEDFNFLLERMPLREILGAETADMGIWMGELLKSVQALEARQEEGLLAYHELRSQKDTFNELGKKLARAWQEGRMNRQGLLECSNAGQVLDNMLKSFETDYSVHPTPVTDTINYRYDYGDNWKVRITCTEVCSDLSGFKKGKPVCVAADGFPVLDDVGGMRGFCEFLRTVNEGGPEEKKESREWARSLGWTGRMSKAENML